jgi:hypothetical protein
VTDALVIVMHCDDCQALGVLNQLWLRTFAVQLLWLFLPTGNGSDIHGAVRQIAVAVPTTHEHIVNVALTIAA